MLKIFRDNADKTCHNKNFQFWRQENHPVELYSPKMSLQKLLYIHQNPVVAGIVEKPEDYLYSSARNYKYGNHAGLLEVVFL
jgi:putative transposase